MTEETAPADKPATRKYVRKAKPVDTQVQQAAPIESAPVPAPYTRKLLILGTTPSRLSAPMLADMDWEVMTIGPGGKDSNRWDYLAELHGPTTWPESFKEYITQLSQVQPEKRICNGREITKSVFTMEPMPGWASNTVMPMRAMQEKYGRNWMSSSISWCFAWAMENQCTDIALYGIDLESGEEYESQYEGAKHFIDVCRLAGIRLYFPKGCGLLRDPDPYPTRWESVPALYVQQKLDYLRPLLTQGHNELAGAQAKVYQLQGQIGALEHYASLFIHKGGDKKIDISSPWS